MRKHIIVGLVLSAFFSFGRTADAIPVSVQLTVTGASGADLFISSLGGAVTALVPFDLAGTIDITIEDFLNPSGSGGESTAISINGSDIELSDEAINLNLGFLGGVAGAISGAGINGLSSNGYIPLTQTSTTNPFEYSFDPGEGSPTELSIDQGLFTYNGTGPVGGLLGSGTVDFSSDPVSATLDPVGQIGLVTQNLVTVLGNYPTVEVVLSVPLTFTDTILTDPITVDVDLSGVLVATGYYNYLIPEPSSVVLLGIGLMALIPLRRRFLRR